MHTARSLRVCVLVAITTSALIGAVTIVETTPSGKTSSRTFVPNGGGDLFGLALVGDARGLYYVNDSGSGSAANSLQTLQR